MSPTFPKQPRNIALVGATGNIGSAILAALLAEKIHNVSVVTRPDSKSTKENLLAAAGVAHVHRGAYDDSAFLEGALKNQDVLILAVGHGGYEAQEPLMRAAAKAGVTWVVPCEFGSDRSNEKLYADVGEMLMAAKERYRALAEELGLRWLGVVNNPWLDFCMRGGYFGIDAGQKTATLWSDCTARANLATLDRTGQSLAALLGLPQDELAARYGNSWVYFSSFRASQRDIFDSVLRATGTMEKEWSVTHQTLEQDVRRAVAAQEASGNPFARAMLLFPLTFAEGYGGDYNDKVVDYELLGLEKEENMDEVVRKIVAGSSA
ncbi:isoflavone reductase family protein [Apiospora kogelbergensis]|uniref:Isoflavone reductase family protein n=1 Tax=Apiospora kogelbergensis TaxID=1337665 RepID=A0AAW0QLB1_9PEZI